MKKSNLKTLVEKINSNNYSSITDYLCESGDIFESVAMDKIDINVDEVEELRESIKNFISNTNSNDHISTAVWALGKLENSRTAQN